MYINSFPSLKVLNDVRQFAVLILHHGVYELCIIVEEFHHIGDQKVLAVENYLKVLLKLRLKGLDKVNT